MMKSTSYRKTTIRYATALILALSLLLPASSAAQTSYTSTSYQAEREFGTNLPTDPTPELITEDREELAEVKEEIAILKEENAPVSEIQEVQEEQAEVEAGKLEDERDK